MARYDSKEEIEKRARKWKQDQPIFDEFQKYLEEHGEGSEALPSSYMFAWEKTKGGSAKYQGYGLDELCSLLKTNVKK